VVVVVFVVVDVVAAAAGVVVVVFSRVVWVVSFILQFVLLFGVAIMLTLQGSIVL
jgi:hypothetical protein